MELGFEGKHFFKDCPEFNCKILSNKTRINETSAILFHAPDIKWKRLPSTRLKNQYYVFYSWEPPTKTWFEAKPADGFFNLTISYRLDSDFFSPYGDFKKISRKYGEENFEQEQVAKIVRNKTKMIAWFVSNCNPFNQRHLYVKELQKYIQVDIFGFCGKNVCKRHEVNCFDLLYDYKFYLSFENSLCKGYVTEKVFERLNFMIVPVVLNKSMYEERFPTKSVISAADFTNVKQLADYLHYLNKNITAYMEYFEWRKEFVVTTDWRHVCEDPNSKKCSFCSLCTFLHRKSKITKIKWDIHKWWHKNTCDSTLVYRLLNVTGDAI